MMLEKIERLIFQITRLSTLVAIFASWFGAFLMFGLGLSKTYDGFSTIAFSDPNLVGDLPRDEATVVHLIGALDTFLIGVVFIYFGHGLYGLFVRPTRSPSDLGLPDWLHVDRIGELKQTVAEVIIVILFVLFLRVALETYHADAEDPSLEAIGRLLLLPVSILLLAAALRLAELHPKRDPGPPKRRRGEGDEDA